MAAILAKYSFTVWQHKKKQFVSTLTNCKYSYTIFKTIFWNPNRNRNVCDVLVFYFITSVSVSLSKKILKSKPFRFRFQTCDVLVSYFITSVSVSLSKKNIEIKTVLVSISNLWHFSILFRHKCFGFAFKKKILKFDFKLVTF